MLKITTKRLVLRDYAKDEFEAFYATTSDPEVQKYYPEIQATRSFYYELFSQIRAWAVAQNRTRYQLAICTSADELIGTCGLRIESLENQQASFGCAIARKYWGNGYAYEASKSILDWGFASLPIHRVFADIISKNTRARALVERLGLRLEGVLRENKYFRGRWWDTAIYAVLKAEWMSGLSHLHM